MFISEALAQTPGGGNPFDIFASPIVPIVLMVVIMYMLVFRPQQKRMKEHRAMVEAVRRGDTVVMQGGLVGKVTKVHDDGELQIEVGQVDVKAKEGNKAAVTAPVRVRVIKSMIAEVRVKGEPASEAAASE